MGTKNYHYNRSSYYKSSYYKQDKEELTPEEREEINELVSFFRDMGFEESSEISKYIRENNLRHRYPHITGYLTMTNEHDTWNFDGGIAPKFYAMICKQLCLDNKHTRSWVIGFKSYKASPNRNS